jgi:hypothetical protein
MARSSHRSRSQPAEHRPQRSSVRNFPDRSRASDLAILVRHLGANHSRIDGAGRTAACRAYWAGSPASSQAPWKHGGACPGGLHSRGGCGAPRRWGLLLLPGGGHHSRSSCDPPVTSIGPLADTGSWPLPAPTRPPFRSAGRTVLPFPKNTRPGTTGFLQAPFNSPCRLDFYYQLTVPGEWSRRRPLPSKCLASART